MKKTLKHIVCFYRVLETLVEVWVSLNDLKEPKASVPTVFRTLPNFHSCFYNAVETRKSMSFIINVTLRTYPHIPTNECIRIVKNWQFCDLPIQKVYFANKIWFNKLLWKIVNSAFICVGPFKR